ncbi:hypothetical protein BDN70DRAFT_371249 [Pholiota conissans]|uniref:Uncharacterized protein n=1 Tax=Pholiota conissans TaxID=109636 RepID=A0A9P5ZFF8_9AGAR|nr:hypothetical protein BDN70DRAFT_371249 [Pholiota conissans]
MPRKALPPKIKEQRNEGRDAIQDAREAQRRKFVDEICALAHLLAPPQPLIDTSSIHDWKVDLNLGKTGNFEDIGFWYAICHNHSGRKCGKFKWLTSIKLKEADLDKLRRLWVLHDMLGAAYSPVQPLPTTQSLLLKQASHLFRHLLHQGPLVDN